MVAFGPFFNMTLPDVRSCIPIGRIWEICSVKYVHALKTRLLALFDRPYQVDIDFKLAMQSAPKHAS